jgi:hypothetical protein
MLTPSRSSATTPSGSRPSSSRGISWAGTRLRGRGRWLRRTCSRQVGAGVCALRGARSRQCQSHSLNARAVGIPPYPTVPHRTFLPVSTLRSSYCCNTPPPPPVRSYRKYIQNQSYTIRLYKTWLTHRSAQNAHPSNQRHTSSCISFLAFPFKPSLRIPHLHLSHTRTILYHMST